MICQLIKQAYIEEITTLEEMMVKQALLIVDVQNDYFKSGKMTLVNAEQALLQIQQLQQHFKQAGLPIIYVQHIAAADAPFFQIDSEGVKIHPDLQVQTDAIVIKKHYPNSFFQTSLQQVLQEQAVEQLVITGMMTHMCIDSTTRAAGELGYQPILITDATATREVDWNGHVVPAEQVQHAFLHGLSWFADLQTTTAYLQQTN